MVYREVPGAIVLGILALTFVGFLLPGSDGQAITPVPEAIFSAPAGIEETFFQLDLLYLFSHFKTVFPILLALLFVDLFDTIGTLIGVSRRANLLDQEDNLPRMSQALTADATATTVGALLGTSTTTSYVESAAGVEAGGRTGLVPTTVAFCFLIALVFTPILSIIPQEATAPALVLVGIFMIHGMSHLDFEDLTEVAPAFITMVAMPLTYSISEGISLGFIAYVVIKGLTGRSSEVSPLTAVLALVFLLHYLLPT
jgi:AGZA family xanthine/uracil permease-like MFS transporter